MRSTDRGSATAELAVALPAVVMLLVVGLSAVAVVTAKLGCVATTRDTALALARGGSPAIPDGATVAYDADTVTVEVNRSVVSCASTAALEP